MEYYLPEYLIPLTQHPTLKNLTSIPLTTNLAFLRTTYLDPYIIQPLATLLASSTPDLVSVLLLAVIFLISIKILDYARRVVMFWVTLFLRIVFWGGLIGLGVYVYRVGVEEAGRALGWFIGVVWGFGEDFLRGMDSGRKSGGGLAGNGFEGVYERGRGRL